ncbi:MAG: non-ribosomal peptide synthetase, partial [Waterburya sp.]
MKDFSQRIAALSPEQRTLLERRLQEKRVNNLKPLISNLQPNSEAGILSSAQERLWLLHQLQPELPLYNEINLFKLTGSLDISVLEKSFNQVLQRHQVLRSRFVAEEGKPVSQIVPSQWVTLPVEQSKEAEVIALATKEARQPFDLSEFPLFRLKLYQLSETQYLWLMVIHHIICDGWSMGIFIKEITTLYADLKTEKAFSLPELGIQYADFARWEKQLPDNIFTTQLKYWEKQLSGSLPKLELPSIHRQIKATNSCRGAREAILLSPQLSQRLKTLSQQQNVTLFMLLLAAFKILLHRYTDLEDILVGSPIANRSRPELEGAIGIFLNTLVLRSDLSGNPTFSELLKQVKRVALEAYSNQDLPFEKIVARLHPERDINQSPLFQVMFILYNLPSSDLELPGLKVEEVAIDNGMALFDLTLEIRDSDRGLDVCFEYNCDRFEANDIQRLLRHYQTILENVVINPDLHLSQIDILTIAERHQILFEWNETQVEYPTDKCIHKLFETQVAKTPGAVAIIYQNQQLTYQELNIRANQLAHYLQILGVKPETLVGICVERSVEMVVGLLGIIKAGGAYVPLNPTHPVERLTEMLSDAQVSILLTQQHLIKSFSQLDLVCLDSDWEFIARQNYQNPEIEVTRDNLAYVIYTSGSTGKPKGVMVEH